MILMLTLGVIAGLSIILIIYGFIDKAPKELTTFQKQLKILQAGGQLFNKVD